MKPRRGKPVRRPASRLAGADGVFEVDRPPISPLDGRPLAPSPALARMLVSGGVVLRSNCAPFIVTRFWLCHSAPCCHLQNGAPCQGIHTHSPPSTLCQSVTHPSAAQAFNMHAPARVSYSRVGPQLRHGVICLMARPRAPRAALDAAQLRAPRTTEGTQEWAGREPGRAGAQHSAAANKRRTAGLQGLANGQQQA
jgi:hypothetical protein